MGCHHLERYGYVDHLTGPFRSPLAVVVLLVAWAGLSAFAEPSPVWARGRRRLPAKAVFGLAHLAVQLAVGSAVGLIAIDLASFASGWLFTVALLLGLATLGGLAGTVVMGAYLAVCCAFLRSHGNEAFSAMGLTRDKNFLRLRIDPDDVLTIYAIAVDQANRRWRYDPDNRDPSAAWIAPGGAEPRPISSSRSSSIPRNAARRAAGEDEDGRTVRSSGLGHGLGRRCLPVGALGLLVGTLVQFEHPVADFGHLLGV